MTRVAYLVSEYPAPSHTFIRREIVALRERQVTIFPFSVRRGSIDIGEKVPSILGEGWVHCVGLAVRALLSSPHRIITTFLLAQRHRVPGIRGLVWAQFHLVEALALATLLKRFNIQRLHTHFANSGATVGLLASHFLQIPWSLALHGISETDPPTGQLLPDKLARADFVTCASWFMRAQAMRVTPPENWHKLHLVRCGVVLKLGENRLPGPKSDSEPEAKKTRFLAVGRLSPEKGYTGLLAAFADILGQGLDAELTIVGEGPLRKLLEQQIAASELGARVRLLGALPEEATLEEISRCEILVLPSLMEGLPVVLMEAMALSKPVIAPAVAGIPELVTHQHSGLLFKPGHWCELSECMWLLARDRALRRQLADRGRQVVAQEFEVHKAIEPLTLLFSGD